MMTTLELAFFSLPLGGRQLHIEPVKSFLPAASFNKNKRNYAFEVVMSSLSSLPTLAHLMLFFVLRCF